MCRAVFFLLFAVSLTSCQENGALNKEDKQLTKKSTELRPHEQALTGLDTNLRDVQSLNPDIQIDLKYTGSANFLGKKLYSKINRAYLQRDVAKRLARVQEALQQKNPGYHLLIYDALRPLAVQQLMWKALDSLPPAERSKFVSNPKNLSLHNMGAAIDLTITDANGKPLDMGAGFDDIRQLAYPIFEDSFLRTGQLTALQVKNRKLLRNAMQAQGFRQLPTEWWHYNACSRDVAKSKYKVFYTENDIFTTPTSN
jgi:D-alanyl-D-alanine dipeptidase